jgi:PLP dependent protein
MVFWVARALRVSLAFLDMKMDISERILHLKHLIQEAEVRYHRASGSVKLIAVSKGQPGEKIKQAYQAGLRDFAENYLQEALAKIQTLTSLSIDWHFIGPIQSNKAATIAQHFTWVHSISRQKVAEQLNKTRPANLPSLNVCIQVNLDEEATKSGLSSTQAEELASFILKLPHLKLRGLMMIPKPTPDAQAQYLSFLRLSDLLHSLNKKLNIRMDTLSMGMSDDWQAAIKAGSTMIRIGTAIFGKREKGNV